MRLIFVIFGILGMCVGLGGYLFPVIRNVEDILPDQDGDLSDSDVEDPAAETSAAEVR